MDELKPYNPLDKVQLGESIAKALLEQPVHPLASLRHGVGAGIYAIYYTGSLPMYEPVAGPNAGGRFQQPLYVGKASPAGIRKGRSQGARPKGPPLRERLGIHARSVDQVENLSLEDFWFRALVVDDIFIPLGESALIQNLRPAWNVLIDGFGNNPPGIRREGQLKSAWDTLHPNRTIAARLPEPQPGLLLRGSPESLFRRPDHRAGRELGRGGASPLNLK